VSGGQRKPETLKFWELTELMRSPNASRAGHAFSSKEERVRHEVETQRFHEKRHRQLAADWLEYHLRCIRAIRKDSAALIKQHRGEVLRYQAMLGIKPSREPSEARELKDAS